MLLWLWLRPAAVAPIRPLAWEPPYTASAALKKKKNMGSDEGPLGWPLPTKVSRNYWEETYKAGLSLAIFMDKRLEILNT